MKNPIIQNNKQDQTTSVRLPLSSLIMRETNKMSRDLYKDFQKMFNPSEFKKTVK